LRPLVARDGAGARSLRQGRPIEPRQHDAEAAVQGDFAEHLRRWAAGGEDRAGHLRLVLDDPLRDTWLGQLDDLTGRPGVDISEDALADLLSQRSLHARSPPCRGNTGGEQKGTPVAGSPETMERAVTCGVAVN
jgi:hypothetical protein